MSEKESYRRTIYSNSRIIYHGRIKKRRNSKKNLLGNAVQRKEARKGNKP